MFGGGCSVCGSPNTTKSTCPKNPLAKNPNPVVHFMAKTGAKSPSPSPVAMAVKAPRGAKACSVKVQCSGTNLSGSRCLHMIPDDKAYCRVHNPRRSPKIDQEAVPVHQRIVKPATYTVVKTKPSSAGRRLSARWYYDNHTNAVGDRCDTHKRGTHECLLVDAVGSPRWYSYAPESKIQGPCQDFSSRCQDPEYA